MLKKGLVILYKYSVSRATSLDGFLPNPPLEVCPKKVALRCSV